ncbi:MAG: hypothetical protein ACI85I_001585 [Arenicella sp.]|jgi:hypothetical protein
MSLINKAVRDRNILLDKKSNHVTYLPHQKTRNLKNPEEEIQLEAFLELIYSYGYPAHKLKVSDRIKMGSASKEADIMVYKDDECKDPYIVVECKKRAVSQKQFDEAIDQGFSYAASCNADFVWVTSGRYNAHFEVLQDKFMEREENKIPRVPKHEESGKSSYQLKKKTFRFFNRLGGIKLLSNPIMTDTLLYMATLAIFVVLFSKLTVEYHNEIWKQIKAIYKGDLDFSHLFNGIMLFSTLLSLGFGMLFMRSHKLLGTNQIKRKIDFIVISIILILPAWYMSVSNSDPEWWYWSHYKEITFKTKIYLWPFLKAFPFQTLAIYLIIWLMTRNSKPKRRKRK